MFLLTTLPDRGKAKGINEAARRCPTDMLQDLNATDSQTDMARQILSIAALLVIFVAGSVGERLGLAE